jgi:predicted Rossmann-fold nucleotide-binding protein
MANYSTGGFVCLPGGYGTFEEMMEMITWNQVRHVVSTFKERLMSSSESILYL